MNCKNKHLYAIPYMNNVNYHKLCLATLLRLTSTSI